MQHSTVPCSRNNEHCYGQETTYKCSSVAEMGYRLATIYMRQKRDRMLCPFRVRSWVSIQYNVAWAEVYLSTKWHLDSLSRLATIDMGRKLGRLRPLWGARSASNTRWPGPRPTSIPSGVLIHQAVWAQYMGRKLRPGVPPSLGRGSWVLI